MACPGIEAIEVESVVKWGASWCIDSNMRTHQEARTSPPSGLLLMLQSLFEKVDASILEHARATYDLSTMIGACEVGVN